jgi:hypothetical protein
MERKQKLDIVIPDFNLIKSSLFVLIDVDVDGEMGVNVTHLVFVAFGDANDEIVYDCADCTESSDILARAMVEFDVDLIFGWM